MGKKKDDVSHRTNDTVKCPIKCSLLIVQSVGNKTHEIRNYIDSNEFNIFMITETWLTAIDSAEINVIDDTCSCIFLGRVGWGEMLGFSFLTPSHTLNRKKLKLLVALNI